MSDQSRSARQRRLSEIIREVKVAAAERDDVVVDMRDADRARLELLAQELEPVIADVPAQDDQFDFALSSGLQPRFWIDAVAHVHMARDRRTYRFVRDTRLGRTLMSETADMAETADAVSRYIAERIIQRQRLLEGDFEAMRTSYETEMRSGGRRLPDRRDRAEHDGADAPSVAATNAPSSPAPQAMPSTERVPAINAKSLLVGVIWFLSGCILGGLLLMASFADRFLQQ
ncbi:hypothetical protein D5400_07545 [Georhizobium profundi]|uniref:Uncharacterized protein n=1 Tax=Georhizobium profundi TaxID=2341112 RepID=A0A3S9B2K9_9HYPH|nr:hypothetical protein [Georhizobium profundi]AZN71144.1 hypothetical protein D5400_07545 [Georhizobium profundi]